MSMTSIGVGSCLPLETLEKAKGFRVWLIMKGDKEFCGTLRGFDDYMHIILDDVKEY